MKTKLRCGIFVLLVVMVIALPALAYDYPLSPEAVREAYMLGKADASKRAEFFAKYTQQFPLPKTGSHVASIQLDTPFAVVVEHTTQTINYYAPDAAEEFANKPGVFRVHVQIDLTESYGEFMLSMSGGTRARPDDFWHDFKICLMQGKEIHPRTTRGTPAYLDGDGSALSGAEVDLEYDATKIKTEPATVEVVTPDGQDVKATFDLGTLR